MGNFLDWVRWQTVEEKTFGGRFPPGYLMSEAYDAATWCMSRIDEALHQDAAECLLDLALNLSDEFTWASCKDRLQEYRQLQIRAQIMGSTRGTMNCRLQQQFLWRLRPSLQRNRIKRRGRGKADLRSVRIPCERR